MVVTPQQRGDFIRSVAVAGAAALLLATSGAFDTGTRPFHERLIYWMVVMGAGSAWGQFCQRLLPRWLKLDGRPWLHIAALAAIVAGPMCLVVWGATGLFFDGEWFPPALLPQLMVPVLTVTAAVSALIVLLGRAVPIRTAASTDPAKPVRFVERLPLHLRAGRIIAVQAEDHYLRVHTDLGSDLILMRLSDAVAELDGLAGAQTHRSWWVAKNAVRGASRGDGRATLELEGGLTAPVSRSYAATLREAGWY
jgi:hypothetical protein